MASLHTEVLAQRRFQHDLLKIRSEYQAPAAGSSPEVIDWLEGELAAWQRCRLCCQLSRPLPGLKNAVNIREFYMQRPYRSSITDPRRVADSLPAHLPAR